PDPAMWVIKIYQIAWHVITMWGLKQTMWFVLLHRVKRRWKNERRSNRRGAQLVGFATPSRIYNGRPSKESYREHDILCRGKTGKCGCRVYIGEHPISRIHDAER